MYTRRREEARPHQARAARDRLHWLRVPQRVQFVYLLTFEALHGLAPPYIADLCRPVTSVGSRHQLADLVVSSSATHFGSRAFAVAGPKGMQPAAGAFTGRDS